MVVVTRSEEDQSCTLSLVSGSGRVSCQHLVRGKVNKVGLILGSQVGWTHGEQNNMMSHLFNAIYILVMNIYLHQPCFIMSLAVPLRDKVTGMVMQVCVLEGGGQPSVLAVSINKELLGLLVQPQQRSLAALTVCPNLAVDSRIW